MGLEATVGPAQLAVGMGGRHRDFGQSRDDGAVVDR